MNEDIFIDSADILPAARNNVAFTNAKSAAENLNKHLRLCPESNVEGFGEPKIDAYDIEAVINRIFFKLSNYIHRNRYRFSDEDMCILVNLAVKDWAPKLEGFDKMGELWVTNKVYNMYKEADMKFYKEFLANVEACGHAGNKITFSERETASGIKDAVANFIRDNYTCSYGLTVEEYNHLFINPETRVSPTLYEMYAEMHKNDYYFCSPVFEHGHNIFYGLKRPLVDTKNIFPDTDLHGNPLYNENGEKLSEVNNNTENE